MKTTEKTIRETVQNFDVDKSPFRSYIWRCIMNSVQDSVQDSVYYFVNNSVQHFVRDSVDEFTKEKTK